ncbi:hypothetical protein OQZ33_04245 [Pedobacter sp. MC2016-05]|uniref:hypothetical protein n=1 Tax=Pedobacter sp. MC2016-05 TaxID=2994474 RepID=UPI002245EE10|nr:hypothetical protein [Pedobacter sp. MC2016-05]MCX2473536.1 hypothetical protein [Pedobacter sp. MC2016-05]
MRENKRNKPILIIDNLPLSFGKNLDGSVKTKLQQIGKDEEILLTLIANIIVEIALREDI